MYSNKLYSPLRYPGGKVRFAPLIASIIRANNLEGGHYLEPYAGGAGVALSLLMDQVVETIHINDFDPAVAVFWRVATRQSRALIDMVAREPVTIDAWHHWRSVMLGSAKGTELHRGFATLFLNRTNRSGILKAGVIGGKLQEGTYKLDARFLRDELCMRLERIGQHARRIRVYEEDALDLLIRAQSDLPPRTLVYLDPPYYVKGSGLYRNFYQHEDHISIAKLLRQKKFRQPWVVSYDDAPEIRDMYSFSRSVSYQLNYTAQRRYKGSEVMFLSERLGDPSRAFEAFLAAAA
ncbi:DNA methyltransferase [Bordetella flabilis]|uniref:site-specific DNA-methyltransferase (adenine-specific) n=2 Tax=Bordetella flabilis TaxID=463014 RepID=A0A193GLK6_9BORD|nr:DNA methyltransferase [Bordetella flabilis]